MDGLCIVGHKKMQNQELEEGAVKGQRDMEEVHYGGEGPHWAIVAMKKKFQKDGTTYSKDGNYYPAIPIR